MEDFKSNISTGGHDHHLNALPLVVLGGILTANSFILQYFWPNQYFASQISAVSGALLMGLPLLFSAASGLLCGCNTVDAQAALAFLAAVAGGDFQTAGAVAFFLLLSVVIENHTADGAHRSIQELIKLTPNTACLVEFDGQERTVAVETLRLGDTIRMRPGENFPVDAVVLSGESTVNQASITGEALPEEKNAGSDVFAGTQNLTGSMTLRVTRLGKDTTLGKVRDLITQAEHVKSPVLRVIDQYTGRYTAVVLLLGCLTWFATGDLRRVIALFVMACPCAIILATPTATVAGIVAATRLGILIKNVAHLEFASHIRAFIFDKTGTLTDGMLSVVRIEPCGLSPAELLKIAVSVEFLSNHPTAMAVKRIAEEAGIARLEVTGFAEIPGQGVSALLPDGRLCRIGRSGYLKKHGIAMSGCEPEKIEDLSTIYVAVADNVIGWIGFKDKLRPEAPEMLRDIRSLGVKFRAMVTGDRTGVAEKIAAQLDLEAFAAECLPEDKVAFVEKTKQSYATAVVGDGVNDAPALAHGNLSIAMGAIGSDIAINSASVALMTNDLGRIPLLLRLSRGVRMIILVNLLVSVLFIAVGIGAAVFGLLPPVLAAILHAVSNLFVVFNSARLLRYGDDPAKG